MVLNATVVGNIRFSGFVGNVLNASVMTCAVFATTKTSMTSGIDFIESQQWEMKKYC